MAHARELQDRRLRAEPRVAEHAQARAHLRHRAARLAHERLDPARARRLAAAQQRGRDEDGEQDRDRRDGERDERAVVAAEEPDGRRTSRAEDRPAPGCSAASATRSCRGRPAAARARAPEAPRHDERARRLAEAGGQGRRHQHADEGALQRVARRTRAPGSAARRIACQARARKTIDEAHEREADEHPRRARAPAALSPMLSMPMRCSASTRGRGRRRGEPRPRGARRPRARGAAAPATRRLEHGRRRVGWTRGRPSAGRRPARTAKRRGRARAAGRGDRSRPRRPRGPRRRRAARRSAARARAAAPPCRRGARGRARGRAAARPARSRRRAGRGGRRRRRAPRRGSRRCRRRRPASRPRTPRSGPCRSSRRPATARTARRRSRSTASLRLVVDLASASMPRSSSSRARPPRAGADDRQPRRHVLAQRLEGAQQHGQALALDGLADEDDAQRVGARGREPAGAPGTSTPLGMTR